MITFLWAVVQLVSGLALTLFLLASGLALILFGVLALRVRVTSAGVILLLLAVMCSFGLSRTFGACVLLLSVILGGAAFLVGKKLSLHTQLDKRGGFIASEAGLEELVGHSGVTLTALRPSGAALIDQKRLAVVTGGFMIPKKTRITVVEVEGNRVVVERTPNTPSEGTSSAG